MSLLDTVSELNQTIRSLTARSKEITAINIVIEKKIGGYLARISAGSGLRKRKAEFVNADIDALFEDLKKATKKGFGLIPKEQNPKA